MNLWGIVALVMWGVAVLGANVSALIPENVFAGLHATRLEGASVNQLKSQVAALETETGALKLENRALMQRAMLSDQSDGEVTRRVGALEMSIPKLLEAIPQDALVDNSTLTASLGKPPILLEAEGGSVAVTTQPMAPARSSAAETAPLQAMPQPLAGSVGLALGGPFSPGTAPEVWASLTTRAGVLLIGLTPLIGNMEGMAAKRLIAGPVRESEASGLCGRFAKAGIACSVVPYTGAALPPAAN
ncbi:MAG: hypothetical protein ABIO40_02155 [Devosia sp.]